MRLLLIGIFLMLSAILSWRAIRLSIFLMVVFFFISPKISLHPTSLDMIFVRFDDILLLTILLVTFMRLGRQSWAIFNTPLTKPISYFIIALNASIIAGLAGGTIAHPENSLLTLLKLIEYFLVFFVICYYTNNRTDLVYYLTAILTGLGIIALYGIYEHFHPLAKLPYPALYRIYERGFFYGQANHLGGTFAFFISLFLGVIIFSHSWRMRFFFLIIILAMIYPFFWTYSRQAELNLVISLTLLGIMGLRFGKVNVRITFMALAIILFLIALSFPQVKSRIASISEVLLSSDIHSSSIAYRITKWKTALSETADYLLLGTGIGSRHRAFYESQWVMFLAETGIIGLLAYIWLLFKIFRVGLVNLIKTNDSFYKGLLAGYLAGLSGLVVQGFVCNIFTITVITAPFYCVLALVTRIDTARDKMEVLDEKRTI